MLKPQISILIPFYNGEKHLPALLQSIYQAAKQDNSVSFEVLIRIDSPATNLVEVQNMVYFLANLSNCTAAHVSANPTNLGVAKTRNLAMQDAKGEFLAFIDQDDMLLPNYFGQLKPYLISSDFILANAFEYHLHARMQYHYYYLKPPTNDYDFFINDYIRTPGQILIKTEIFRQVAGFPESKIYHGSDDRHAWIRLFKIIKPLHIQYIHAPILRCVIHSDNFSHDGKQLYLSGLELWDLFVENKIFDAKDKYLIADKARLQYQIDYINGSTNWFRYGFLQYLNYKFALGKVCRYIVKKTKLVLKLKTNLPDYKATS